MVSQSKQEAQCAEWMEKGDCLTVMIKGIPCSCKRSDVLNVVKELGFVGQYNFFYVPMKRERILGYAFIGFPDAELTKKFAMRITGYRFSDKASAKSVTVAPATIQGHAMNLMHFRDTSVMNSDSSKPFFSGQKEVSTSREENSSRDCATCVQLCLFNAV
jgi:hypothetical protein